MKRNLLTLLFVLIMTFPAFSDQNIKKPNVSGQFYTSNPQKLTSEIDGYLDHVTDVPSDKDVKIVISPHAGYKYSGHVAAWGYKSVSNKKINTVVILAPSHHFALDGASVWEEGGYETPLGTVPVDAEFAKKLIAADEKIVHKPEVFSREHSLEVQIPFLQRIFKDFRIVPVIVGHTDYSTCEKIADGLKKVIGDREDVLIVVSTDMSHFYDDAAAKNLDRIALNTIKGKDPKKLFSLCKLRKTEMCGFIPVTISLIYAQKNGIDDVDILKYAHSGHVTGDMSSVVGYTSIVLSSDGKKKSKDSKKAAVKKDGVLPLTKEQKKKLIAIARETIEEYVRSGKVLDFDVKDPRLSEVEGAFVTIHKRGMLRGCIGNIIGQGPLHKTVRDMAVSSATRDPRFQPVKEKELAEIDVEISVLSKPKRVRDVNKIEMGKHGVIVSQGLFRKGVFLPQVATETGWSREEFLSNLCAQKAGLPANAWKDPKTVLKIFSAEVFSEKEVLE